MAALSLFWDTNTAAVTPCENAVPSCRFVIPLVPFNNRAGHHTIDFWDLKELFANHFMQGVYLDALVVGQK